jgi:RNA polymerase sigma factor (sigma-70 family)
VTLTSTTLATPANASARARVNHPTIERLTAAMAAGDEGAVETFYRRYFDWLYAQARRAARGRDDAFCLDVVQDAVLRVIRTVRGGCASEAQFRGWLRLVVQTSAYDRLRSERRTQRRELVAAAMRDETVLSGCDEVDDADQIGHLRAQIARLDPVLVTMIEMRFERRWTLRRIARAMGMSIGSVDGRLRRALARLREQSSVDCDD